MARLAIRGHKTRGSEVIALLEMLGGVNSNNLYCDKGYAYYIIDSDKEIKGGSYVFGDEPLCHFTLEEFEEKFPYKVGDKATHNMGILMNVVRMYWDAECNVIRYDIQSPVDNNYKLKAMLAEHLQPYKEETMEDKPNLLQQLKDYFDNTPREVVEKEWHEYDKYNEISPKVNEYLEYVNNIRQPKYPKTYEECCDILKIPNDERYIDVDVPLDYNKSLSAFTKLLICRDAYWKIAGEQMGLDKPWKPDWNEQTPKYTIDVLANKLVKRYALTQNFILVFPTKEMRDAFYENFKELIENVKELL